MDTNTVLLYHGSNDAVQNPIASHNTGFADLGRGFYLTTNRAAAIARAVKRARRMGGPATVSVFELDEKCVPWLTWGAKKLDGSDATTHPPFGLQFDETPKGLAAWASYITACRSGNTEVPQIGSPAIVRAWIATEEVEMMCAGFLTAEELSQALEPSELVVQYCILDQGLLDHALRFVRADVVV